MISILYLTCHTDEKTCHSIEKRMCRSCVNVGASCVMCLMYSIFHILHFMFPCLMDFIIHTDKNLILCLHDEWRR